MASLPPLWIPAFAGMTKLGAGLRKGCCERGMRGCLSSLSRIGVRGMLSTAGMTAAGMPLSGDKTQRHTLLFRRACWIRVD